MSKMSQEQINVDLFDEVVKLQNENNEFKDGIREIKKYIDERTGSVSKPRQMSIEESKEVFDKLTELLNHH